MFGRNFNNGDLSWKILINVFLLSFLSGNVNAGGFLACQRFVTHVTGFATLFGVDLATGRLDAAFGILTVPFYFLFGVMISAYLIDRPFRLGRRPHYTVVMGLVALCLVIASLLGHYEYFGRFGDVVKLKRDYFLLVLLCLASGLQNAAVTTSSGTTLRTTHLTGIITDLGIGMVRAQTWPRHSPEFRQELQAAKLRIGTIVSFALGSATGAALFFQFKYLGFLLPAAIALYAMWLAKLQVSYWEETVSVKSSRKYRIFRQFSGG